MQRCWGGGKGFSGKSVEVAIHGKASEDPASAPDLLDSFDPRVLRSTGGGERLWFRGLFKVRVFSLCLPWLHDLWFCSIISEKQLGILLGTGKYQSGAGAVGTL